MLNYDEYDCSHDGKPISRIIGSTGCGILVICLLAVFINYVNGAYSNQIGKVYTLAYIGYTLISFTYFTIIINSLGKIRKHKSKVFPTKLLLLINAVINISLLVSLLNYLGVTKIILRPETIDRIIEIVLVSIVLLAILILSILLLYCIANVANKLEEEVKNIDNEE